MKKLSIIAVALVGAYAVAQVTTGPWVLDSGKTYTSEAKCVADAKLTVGTHYCVKATKIVVAPTPVPTPTPTPVPTPTPTPTPPPSLMPVVDRTKIPTGSAGVSVEQFTMTTEQPAIPADGTGSFRTACDFSHMNFDDPIIFPGQPGASHLHAYFGNTGANAASTANSIATAGNSTCRGGILNRTAYWVPAIIDTRTHAPVKPTGGLFYYKTGYGGIAPANVSVFPAGLRMIAGDPKAIAPPVSWEAHHHFDCVTADMRSDGISNCPKGDQMRAFVIFPQCWDGVNLDSPDHRSHMAYPSGGKCPSTHPVAGPEITTVIEYDIAEANAPLYWRLSSDNYSASNPGGWSSHADWFNGWKPEAMSTFVAKCLQPAKDCHVSLLGDGRAIY